MNEYTFKDGNVTGTRVVMGEAARLRRKVIEAAAAVAKHVYEEISLPTLYRRSMFAGAVKDEDMHRLYTIAPRKESDHDDRVCLAPECTAACMELARTVWKQERDKRVWYEQRCFRGDRPQKGRWREFTQVGFEVLNPVATEVSDGMAMFAFGLLFDIFKVAGIEDHCVRLDIRRNVPDRGHHYYTSGWEIHAPWLGSCSQIAGGGSYANGYGFALGVDRVVMAVMEATQS